MNAIFILNHIHTQNKAISCIFVPSFIARNRKKNIFSFCNKIFWAGLIFLGWSWDWKHLIFYFRPSLMFCMFAMCVISVKTDDYMDSGTMEQLHVQLCNIATTTQLDLNTTTTAVTFHSSVSQPLHHDRIDLNLVVYSVA